MMRLPDVMLHAREISCSNPRHSTPTFPSASASSLATPQRLFYLKWRRWCWWRWRSWWSWRSWRSKQVCSVMRIIVVKHNFEIKITLHCYQNTFRNEVVSKFIHQCTNDERSLTNEFVAWSLKPSFQKMKLRSQFDKSLCTFYVSSSNAKINVFWIL